MQDNPRFYEQSEYNIYIFPISEIEYIILQYLDPLMDYKILSQVNHYYFQIIESHPIYIELKDFASKEKYLEIFSEIEFHDRINEVFTKACMYGYPLIVKYLFSKYSKEIDVNIHICDEYTFRKTCSNGHLEIAKILYTKYPNINIHSRDEWAFRYSCMYGHLEVIKYLLSVDGKTNIHAFSEYGFRWSCLRGYLDIAKFLYHYCQTQKDQKPIDIRILQDDAFRWSCRFRKKKIVAWLATLCDRYSYMIPTDGDIHYTIRCH